MTTDAVSVLKSSPMQPSRAHSTGALSMVRLDVLLLAVKCLAATLLLPFALLAGAVVCSYA